MRKIFVILLVGFLIVLLGGGTVAGYGFYRASLVKSYAREAKRIMEESNQVWSQKKLENTNYTEEEIKEQVRLIRSDSEKRLNELAQLRAVRDVSDLKRWSEDYFTTAREIAIQFEKVFDYLDALKNVEDSLRSLSGSTSGFDEFASKFGAFHKRLNSSLTKLKETAAPVGFENFHQSFVKYLDNLDQLIVDAVDAAKKHDANKLNTFGPEFDKLIKTGESIKPPAEDQTFEKIATRENKDILREYPDKVKREADLLLKTRFSFNF